MFFCVYLYNTYSFFVCLLYSVYDFIINNNSLFVLKVLLNNNQPANLLRYALQVRSVLGDFAVLVAIVLWTSVDFFLALDTPKLNVPREIVPTSPSRYVTPAFCSLPICVLYSLWTRLGVLFFLLTWYTFARCVCQWYIYIYIYIYITLNIECCLSMSGQHPLLLHTVIMLRLTTIIITPAKEVMWLVVFVCVCMCV